MGAAGWRGDRMSLRTLSSEDFRAREQSRNEKRREMDAEELDDLLERCRQRLEYLRGSTRSLVDPSSGGLDPGYRRPLVEGADGLENMAIRMGTLISRLFAQREPLG